MKCESCNNSNCILFLTPVTSSSICEPCYIGITGINPVGHARVMYDPRITQVNINQSPPSTCPRCKNQSGMLSYSASYQGSVCSNCNIFLQGVHQGHSMNTPPMTTQQGIQLTSGSLVFDLMKGSGAQSARDIQDTVMERAKDLQCKVKFLAYFDCNDFLIEISGPKLSLSFQASSAHECFNQALEALQKAEAIQC